MCPRSTARRSDSASERLYELCPCDLVQITAQPARSFSNPTSLKSATRADEPYCFAGAATLDPPALASAGAIFELIGEFPVSTRRARPEAIQSLAVVISSLRTCSGLDIRRHIKGLAGCSVSV